MYTPIGVLLEPVAEIMSLVLLNFSLLLIHWDTFEFSRNTASSLDVSS
jgi:hypothetical protein